jgi:uncharacterized protein (TIGR04255 family)
MSKKYRNAPIIEAVCEFRFPNEVKWDLTIPGLLYEKIKNEFPVREQRWFQEVETTKTPQGVEQQVRANERALLFADDRKSFVQIGTHLLAINCLKPYPAWNGFLPKIETALHALTQIVSIGQLQRIGLRYINRVGIAQEPFRLEEYFEFRPFLGGGLPATTMTDFLVGCVLPFSGERDSCKIQLATVVPDQPGGRAFLLDLDYFLSQPDSILADQALEWVENAHRQVENLFEGCITNRLRDLFQEVE